jgi:hypothetical protein
MATNILILPLAQITVITGNNENWLDSLQYVEFDGLTPVDLTGISFLMEMRHLGPDVEVFVRGSTEDGKLVVGGTNNSFLLINIPHEEMKEVPAQEYVADITANADGYTRVIAQLTVAVFQGVTRP